MKVIAALKSPVRPLAAALAAATLALSGCAQQGPLTTTRDELVQEGMSREEKQEILKDCAAEATRQTNCDRIAPPKDDMTAEEWRQHNLATAFCLRNQELVQNACEKRRGLRAPQFNF